MWKHLDWSFVPTMLAGMGAGMCLGLVWVCEAKQVLPPTGAVLTGAVLLVGGAWMRSPLVRLTEFRRQQRNQ